MGSSQPLVAVGVGVLVALSHISSGYSQELDANAVTAENAQTSSEASSEKVDESPLKQRAMQAEPAIANSPKLDKLERSTTEKPKPNHPNARKKAREAATNKRTNQTAQADPATSTPATGTTPTTGTTPASLIPTVPVTPTIPALPFQSLPIGPAKSGMPPEYLNPDPNPLSFPTRPEEVRLGGIQPITLSQAIELAKRNSRIAASLDNFQTRNFQTAYLALEQARAQLRQAQAARYPTIGATSQITQSQDPQGQLQEEAARQQRAEQAERLNQPNQPGSRPPITQSDRSSLTLNGTVQVSYNIYTGGFRPAQIRAAERQVRIAELQYERSWIVLQEDVKTAYYNLQQADENVRIQQSAVRNAAAGLRDAQALERAGIGTQFDVLRAQVQLANAQQQSTRSIAGQNGQNVSRQQLAQLLAVPPTIELAAADPVDVRGVWNITLERTILLALKYSTQLEQLLVQREVADQQRIIALSALKPRVNLSVQYNVLNNLRDTLGFGDGYSVAAGFQWDFFDGGAARASARQRELDKRIAESNFAGIRELIIQEARSQYGILQSSFTNIATARQALQQAREALRLARLRFQAGVGTQTEVINAENDLTNSEGNLVTAILDYNRAIAALERIVGTLPIPTGATIPSVPSAVSPTASPLPSPPSPVGPSVSP